MIVEKNFREFEEAIGLILNARKQVPALILIYSSIDFLAWLNRPSTHPDVVRSDFISWVDRYLLPNSQIRCSSQDLYAARCGVLHSYSAESKLSREGRAKQIWYAWGRAEVKRLQKRIKQTRLDSKAVAVHIEDLFNALRSGFVNFMTCLDADPDHANLVYERARRNLFTNIPPNL
jgi:hypothetical protein